MALELPASEHVGAAAVGAHALVQVGPDERTVLALAEEILRLTGSSSKIVHVPLPPDDPRQRRPDITLARARLRWSPKVPLRDGLLETIRYFREQR